MKRILYCCLSASVLFACKTNQETSTTNTVQQDQAATAAASTTTTASTSSATMEQNNILTEAEKAAGWELLFDGESIDQWRGFKKDSVPEAWQVQEGALVLTGKGGGDILTKEQYEDFELMLDWKIIEGGNSGIFFHVQEGDYKTVWQTGPEMQILDDERHPDAKQGKNGNRTAGSNYDLIAPSAKAVKPAGSDFNRVRLVVNDSNVQHWLNGVKVVEYQLGSPEWEEMVKNSKFANMPDYGRTGKGHIVLQDHGDKVWFRNIKIRRL